MVLPGGLIEQTVSNPRLAVAAPDLLLAEYDIRINASAFVKQDDDTRSILQDAMDDLIAEIADLMLGDGPLGGIPSPRDPRDPHPEPGDPTGGGHPGVVDPGPLDDPPHPADVGAREAIEHLLQRFKDLNRMQSGAVVTAYYADVYVDDQHVCSVRKGILPNRHKGAASLSIVRARTRPNAKSRAFREARREDKRQKFSIGRGKASMPTSLAGAGPDARTATEKTIKEALQRIRDLLHGFDLRLDPPTEDDGDGRCTVFLTTGPHRLRTSWNVVSIFQEGSVLGAAEAASTQTSVTVDFTPRNPNGWPRLDGSLAKIYSGARSGDAEEIVQMPHSAVDLLVQQGSNTLRLLAATGKPDQPFAAPVAFQVQPGAAISSVVAGPADAIGRSSVVVLLPSGLQSSLERRPLWLSSNGLCSFDSRRYGAAVRPSRCAGRLQLPHGAGGDKAHGGFRFPKRQYISNAAPSVRHLDLAPLALGDPATSLVRLNNAGTRWCVSFRLQGETQAYGFQGQQLVMTGALTGLDAPSGRVLPVATLRGSFVRIQTCSCRRRARPAPCISPDSMRLAQL